MDTLRAFPQRLLAALSVLYGIESPTAAVKTFLPAGIKLYFGPGPLDAPITKRRCAPQSEILYRVIKNVVGAISSGTGPHREAGINEPIEFAACGTGPGLNTDALDNGVEEVGQ